MGERNELVGAFVTLKLSTMPVNDEAWKSSGFLKVTVGVSPRVRRDKLNYGICRSTAFLLPLPSQFSLPFSPLFPPDEYTKSATLYTETRNLWYTQILAV